MVVKKSRVVSVCVMVLWGVLWGEGHGSSLRFVTTTSLQDSGVVRVLLENYASRGGVAVRNIAVGSGAAFVLGRRGDADVLIVHERKGEEDFLAAGYGVKRYEWLRNDFVVLGHEEDRAGVGRGVSIEDVFMRLARRGEEEGDVVFVSRGDESGTYRRELLLQERAGVDLSLSLGSGYVLSGQGMGASLNMADNWGAYILTDKGSWLNRENKNREMRVWAEGFEGLENPYSVMILKGSLGGEKREEVRSLLRWLFSEEVRSLLRGYTLSGEEVFVPSEGWPTGEEIDRLFSEGG